MLIGEGSKTSFGFAPSTSIYSCEKCKAVSEEFSLAYLGSPNISVKRCWSSEAKKKYTISNCKQYSNDGFDMKSKLENSACHLCDESKTSGPFPLFKDDAPKEPGEERIAHSNICIPKEMVKNGCSVYIQ